MSVSEPLIHSDPEILGGTPVFVGTRVPVQTFLEYLEHGHPLDEFLDHFPSVRREQAVAVLELAKEMLLARASAASAHLPRDRDWAWPVQVILDECVPRPLERHV